MVGLALYNLIHTIPNPPNAIRTKYNKFSYILYMLYSWGIGGGKDHWSTPINLAYLQLKFIRGVV